MFISKQKYDELIADKTHWLNMYNESSKIISKLFYRKEDCCYTQYFNYKGKEIKFTYWGELLREMEDWDKFLDNTETLKKVNTKS